MSIFFFFNDTATTEIYTLSLHDALPIWKGAKHSWRAFHQNNPRILRINFAKVVAKGFVKLILKMRSEEHTSELQSHLNLVCRLLLEKKISPRPMHSVASPRAAAQARPPI